MYFPVSTHKEKDNAKSYYIVKARKIRTKGHQISQHH